MIGRSLLNFIAKSTEVLSSFGFRKIQKRIDSKIEKQCRLLSQLEMWNEIVPLTSKRRLVNPKGSVPVIGHKRTKKPKI